MTLYVDWKNLYKRSANAGERLRGEEPVTQFGRMCEVADRADRREFPASQGASGTSARHTSGPLSEKTTEGDPQSRRPLSFEPEMNRAIGEICKTQKQSQPSVRLIYAKK